MRNRSSGGRKRLSVILPALDAEHDIRGAIASAPTGAEVIVVDGGSSDATVEVAQGAGAAVLRSPPGRAVQLNRGAEASRGDILLFVHADCRLPKDAQEQVERVLAQSGAVGGWFPQRIAGAGPLLRFGASGANRRARHLRLPYGDQAIFARRAAFRRAGGFPPDPIMEDAGFARRLRRIGRIAPAESFVTTGARHWKRLGPVATATLDYFTLVAWSVGVSPNRIARFYRRLHEGRRN